MRCNITFGTRPVETFGDVIYFLSAHLHLFQANHLSSSLPMLGFLSSCLWRLHHQAEWFNHQPGLAQRVPPKQELHLAAGCPHAVSHHSALWRLRDWGQWREHWGYYESARGGFVLCPLSVIALHLSTLTANRAFLSSLCFIIKTK